MAFSPPDSMIQTTKKRTYSLLSSLGFALGLATGTWALHPPAVQAHAAHEDSTHLPGFDAQIITATFQAPREGSAKNIQGQIQIKNISRKTVKITVVPIRTGFQNVSVGGEFRQGFALAPGATVQVPIQASLSTPGPQVIYVPVKISEGNLGRGQAIAAEATVIVDQGGGYRRATFTDAFGPDLPLAKFPGGPVEPNPFQVFDPDKAASLSRQVKLPSSLDMAGEPGSDRPVVRPNLPRPSNPAINLPNFDLPGPFIKFVNGVLDPKETSTPKRELAQGSTTTLQGQILFRSTNGNHYPATNWLVRVMAGDRELGRQYIQGDGRFSFTIPTNTSNPRVLVSSDNRWFQVTNPSTSDPYLYGIPPEALNLSPGTTNLGSWVITNSLVGDVYQEGQRLWSRLYYVAGLNPLRNQPVDVAFPETRARCSGNVWSCASPDGWISLLEIHAAPGVMAHELSHQADFQWNGWTPRSGGNHSFGVCYSPSDRDGMILTEGFANFLPTWALSDSAGRSSGQNYHNFRGLTGPVGNLDLETSPPEPGCGNNTAELQFSAALWDGHDTQNDGQDGIHYVHPAAQILTYAAGNRGNVSAFLDRLYSLTNPDWGKTAIENVYNQNGVTRP